jgi:hypothetical protein
VVPRIAGWLWWELWEVPRCAGWAVVQAPTLRFRTFGFHPFSNRIPAVKPQDGHFRFRWLIRHRLFHRYQCLEQQLMTRCEEMRIEAMLPTVSA